MPTTKTKRKPREIHKCPECGSDELFSGFFDEDDLAVPQNIGDNTPGVRWTTFCNQCGAEAK